MAKNKEEKDLDALDMDKQVAKRFKDDSDERLRFAKWVRFINTAYLGVVMLVVMLQGAMTFHFSNEVMIALLGTTTANVLGLAYIILHGLFDKEPRK